VPGAANPQALNRYTYVFNNPLKYTDPSGHDPRDDTGNNMNDDCNYAGWCQPWTNSGGRFDPISYIRDEMVRNPSVGIARLIEMANFLGYAEPSQKILAMILWFAMVRPNGEWDHKPKIQSLVSNGLYADDIGAIWLQVGNEAFEYRFDVFSNIHFGYVGMAIGFSAAELLEGAGEAQYLSDLVKNLNKFPSISHFGDPSLSLVFPYDHGQGGLGTSLRHWDEVSDQAAIKVGNQWC
jgi:hypothetical protein